MSAFRDWLLALTVGPRCDICGDRRRGWRTLAAHRWVDHGDLSS